MELHNKTHYNVIISKLILFYLTQGYLVKGPPGIAYKGGLKVSKYLKPDYAFIAYLLLSTRFLILLPNLTHFKNLTPSFIKHGRETI